MNNMQYKGYQGSIQVDMPANVLHGKILFISDLVTYEAQTVAQLHDEFKSAVDDYLQTCQQLGRTPQKICSGQFNVRVGQALHQAAVLRAMKDGVKLNAVVVAALEQYLTGEVSTHQLQHNPRRKEQQKYANLINPHQ